MIGTMKLDGVPIIFNFCYYGHSQYKKFIIHYTVDLKKPKKSQKYFVNREENIFFVQDLHSLYRKILMRFTLETFSAWFLITSCDSLSNTPGQVSLEDERKKL